jgi:hypothetical protein
MKFEQFIAQLTQLGFVGPWHFAPKVANAREGQTFHVTNRGGEVHTFTEVAKFGGGIAEDLNKLAHTPVVAPECLSLAAGDFIAPGGTFSMKISRKRATRSISAASTRGCDSPCMYLNRTEGRSRFAGD